MLAAIALALRLAAPPQDADALAAEAQTAIASGDYAEALEAIERAYELEPNPMFLYGRAQAKRLLGRCEEAIEDYRAFLENDVPDAAADDARANIRRCRETASAPPPEPTPEPLPAAQPPEPAPARSAPPPVGAAPQRPWHRDPAAGVLVGVGAAAIVTGVVLYAVAVAALRNPSRSPHEQAYRDRIQGRQNLGYAGIGIGAAGALLVAGGTIRWGLLKRRGR